jgi:hypothetical protein
MMQKMITNYNSGRNAATHFLKLSVLLYVFISFPFLLDAQDEKLIPPTSVEIQSVESNIDHKLLPSTVTKVEIEGKQVFKLKAGNEVKVTIIPVRLDLSIPSSVTEAYTRNVDEIMCGVYLIHANGRNNFVELDLDRNTPDRGIDSCRTEAIGLLPVAGSGSSIILVNNKCDVIKGTHDIKPGSCVRRIEVLSWNSSELRYTEDKPLSIEVRNECPRCSVKQIVKSVGRISKKE